MELLAILAILGIVRLRKYLVSIFKISDAQVAEIMLWSVLFYVDSPWLLRIWRPYRFRQGIFSVRIIKGFVIQSIKIPNVQDHMIPLTRYFYSELLKKELWPVWKYIFCIKCYLKILVPLWNLKLTIQRMISDINAYFRM